jgi:hypothetical protein
LESVANAHTAADLHVRPGPQSALVSRTVGAANDLRDTASLISRNENDSSPLPAKTTWRFAKRRAIFRQSCKVLNLYEESNHAGAVTIHVTAQNKFTNRLSLAAVELNFQTSRCHYADK